MVQDFVFYLLKKESRRMENVRVAGRTDLSVDFVYFTYLNCCKFYDDVPLVVATHLLLRVL
jgi:hypothetical protein